MGNSVVVIRRDDGYTIPTRIKSYSGRGEVELHGELNFDRRPTDARHVAMFHDAIDRKSETQILDIASEMIVAQVKKWDATDEHGNPLPLTVEGVKSLHWRLITRLRDIICFAADGGDKIEVLSNEPDSSVALLESLRKN